CSIIKFPRPDNPAWRHPLWQPPRDTLGKRKGGVGSSPGQTTHHRKKPDARKGRPPPSSTSVSRSTCWRSLTAIATGSRARLGSKRIAALLPGGHSSFFL